MPYRPSADTVLPATLTNAFWKVLEPLYDGAAHLSPLPRDSYDVIKTNYVHLRKGDDHQSIANMKTRLPPEFRDFSLGAAEIDLLDLLINYKHDRVLAVVGRRGAGKSSLLHYVESVAIACRYSAPPIFLIIDCLQLAATATDQNMAILLATEMRDRAKLQSGSMESYLIEASNRLSQSPNDAALALRSLVDNLGEHGSRIVIAFDNLDQAPSDLVYRAFELARQFYVSADVAVLLTVRPGTLWHSYGRGDARAFIHYSIRVAAPSCEAWLNALKGRLVIAFDDFSKTHNARLELDGRRIERVHIERVIDNLVRELQRSRHPGDNSLSIIEAMSADDTRHMVQLVRRTLMHRDFPAQSYAFAKSPSPIFHPLIAVLEGAHPTFRHSDTTPNLLCFDAGGDNLELMLLHRLLSLLKDPPRSVPGEVLIRRLALLGYSPGTSFKALDLLHRSLLIESRDYEVPRDEQWYQTEIALTEGGAYYINHMIQTADYGLCAVLDVPLSHSSVQRVIRSTPFPQGIDFSQRLLSLVEYAGEVRKHEQAQIRRLLKVEPSVDLRAVAHCLRHGGTLLSCLCVAIDAAIERSQSSDSPPIRSAQRTAREALKRLMTSVESMESRLEDVVNRGWKANIEPLDRVTVSAFEYPGCAVEVSFERGGEGGVVVAGFAEPELGAIAVSISIETDKGTSHVAAPLQRQPVSAGMSTETGRAEPYRTLISHIPSWSYADIRFDRASSTFLALGDNQDGIALLCAEENGSESELRLYTNENRGDRWTPKHVGSVRDSDRILNDCKNTLGQVVANDPLQHEHAERLMEMGVRLRRKVFSPEGANHIASVRHLVNRLVFIAGDTCSQLPIELILFEGLSENERYILGECWSIVRWTGHPIDGMVNFARSRVLESPARSNEMLYTTGLPLEHAMWWRGSSANVSDLVLRLCSPKVVHIVGHHDTNDNSIVIANGDSTLRIRLETFDAFPFHGPSDVILSICGSLPAAPSSNIAASISRLAKCRVWVPICKITDTFAHSVDLKLAAHLHSNSSPKIHDLFRTGTILTNPLELYLQYGQW